MSSKNSHANGSNGATSNKRISVREYADEVNAHLTQQISHLSENIQHQLTQTAQTENQLSQRLEQLQNQVSQTVQMQESFAQAIQHQLTNNNSIEQQLTQRIEQLQQQFSHTVELQDRLVEAVQTQFSRVDTLEQKFTQKIENIERYLTQTTQPSTAMSEGIGESFEREFRRLYKRLFVTEKKIQRQQTWFFAGLTFLALGSFFFHFLRQSPPPAPAPTGQSIAPPQAQKVEPEQLSAFFRSEMLARSPQTRQRLRGKWRTYTITDTYRVRMQHPSTKQRSPPRCAGKSLEQIDRLGIKGCIAHRGADVATPVGTPLFAIARSGSFAQVECRQQPPWGTYAQIVSPSLPHWIFIAHHLNTCQPGRYTPGQSFGTTGTAGTGPHLHFGSRYQGRWIAPPLGFIQWVLGRKDEG